MPVEGGIVDVEGSCNISPEDNSRLADVGGVLSWLSMLFMRFAMVVTVVFSIMFGNAGAGGVGSS